MKIPEDALGGDLIWWRESPTLHTAITLWGGEDDLRMLGSSLDEASLLFQLYDVGGNPLKNWTDAIRPGVPVTIDSKDYSGIAEEGVLAIFSRSADSCVEKYRRLFSMVDWYSEDGELVSLHSDQSISKRDLTIELTEIVFLETLELRNYLVLVNSGTSQAPDSLELSVRNHRGDMRCAPYHQGMPPFSLHKLRLAEIFPGLNVFCDGCPATLEGRFSAKELFCRPYVITEGRHLAGYHGGNRYYWPSIPRFIYKALGRGEVNPMAVIQSEKLRTAVHVLNSHGDLNDDFWVDARLYDRPGNEIVYRRRWLLAQRHAVSQGEIDDLIGHDNRFVGHIALSFSDDDKTFYPRRLQAQLEYRTAESTAKVMAWSDIWNARGLARNLQAEFANFFDLTQLYDDDYIGASELTYRCHYRIWLRGPIRSFIAITNCGITRKYGVSVRYILRLFNTDGDAISYHGCLGPHATDYEPIDRFFPAAAEFLGPAGIGVASVASTADLAVMHFSEHQLSGVISAEHFLASVNFKNGKYHTSCGA